MTAQEEFSSGHDGFVFLSGMIVGAIVGLSAGLLIAPNSGAVTRRKILRTAGEAKDHVSEVIDDLEETGRDLINDVKRAVH